MPAHSDKFPWTSHHGHYSYFQDRMKSHSKVSSIIDLRDGIYNLTLINNTTLKVFICDCYAFGLAQVHETKQRINNLDTIIINSAWCNYTLEAKILCREEKVGLFNIKDFMAALNTDEHYDYLNKEDKKKFLKDGLL